jgi:hypothetical protein
MHQLNAKSASEIGRVNETLVGKKNQPGHHRGEPQCGIPYHLESRKSPKNKTTIFNETV